MGPRVLCIGPHIVDVLVRPVVDIPPGQGGRLIEDARLTAAGTAAGVAVDLAKLGADVTSIGAVGSDALGRFLRMLLDEHGVRTEHLAVRAGQRTSTTLLPIRPNGERPTLHLPGATGTLSGADVPAHLVTEVDVVHLGGPDVLLELDDAAPDLLARARAAGARTSVDLIRNDQLPETLDRLGRMWPHVDLFLPNDDQLRSLTGVEDLEQGARVLLDRGVGTVVVTCGPRGSLVVDGAGTHRTPSFDLVPVDTTGCGDAFSAGLLVGLHQGWPLPTAVGLATAAGALVAQGLGSDAGIVDLPTTLAWWAERADQIAVAPPAPAA